MLEIRHLQAFKRKNLLNLETRSRTLFYLRSSLQFFDLSWGYHSLIVSLWYIQNQETGSINAGFKPIERPVKFSRTKILQMQKMLEKEGHYHSIEEVELIAEYFEQMAQIYFQIQEDKQHEITLKNRRA